MSQWIFRPKKPRNFDPKKPIIKHEGGQGRFISVPLGLDLRRPESGRAKGDMEAMRSAPAPEIARSGHPFPWLNLMVTEPFYLLHVLLFCSYFAARSSSVQSLPSDLSNHLIHRVALLMLYYVNFPCFLFLFSLSLRHHEGDYLLHFTSVLFV